MGLTRETLLAFLVRETGLEAADLEGEALLFSSGLVDSFTLVALLQFLEDESGVRVPSRDISLPNLDTVERILAYVDRARSEGTET